MLIILFLYSLWTLLCWQAPAEDLQLPYSAKYDATITISEIWTSSSAALSGKATRGSIVSILPYEQWQPTKIKFAAKLTAIRDFTPWTALHGSDHVESILGTQRWQLLGSLSAKTNEKFIGEVEGACDLTNTRTAARCMYAKTLFNGPNEGDAPLVESGVFLQWQDIKYLGEDVSDTSGTDSV